MRGKLLVLTMCLLALAGCAAPTLDGSSDEAMKESVKQVRDSLPESEREAFDQSLKVVSLDVIAPGGNIFAVAGQDPSAIAGQLRSKLDGKSAEQLVAMADSVRETRQLKEKEQAMADAHFGDRDRSFRLIVTGCSGVVVRWV